MFDNNLKRFEGVISFGENEFHKKGSWHYRIDFTNDFKKIKSVSILDFNTEGQPFASTPLSENCTICEINMDWMHQSTRYIDYLANPTVLKKNSRVIMQLFDFHTTTLMEDNFLFPSFVECVKHLKELCYSVSIESR